MAASVILLQFFQNCHQFIGIFPSQSNQKYLSRNSIKAILLIPCALFTISSAAFFFIEAKSMFEFALSFFMIICGVNAIVVYLILVWQSENTLEFIESCENFIGKRLHVTAAYNETIGKIELFNKVYGFALSVTYVIQFFLPAPYTFVQYYIFNMEEDSFYLFAPSWYPFDWKTPFGYLMAWLVQIAGILLPYIMCAQFPNMMFGSCWLFVFIAEDITQDVAAFNFMVTATSDENGGELTKRFCDLVQIYSDAKQCVMEFNQTIEYSLFSFFAGGLFSLAAVLVTIQFELWADDSSLFEIAVLVLVLIWMLVFNFLFCEPGARVTNQFEGFSDELSRCDWYALSPKMQRMYALFLSDTQNPITLYSYAGITCGRDTFKRIINAAHSYFMTFRNFQP